MTSLMPVEKKIELPRNKCYKLGAVIVHGEPEKLDLSVNMKQYINFTAIDQCF